jgi:hypothetical protein
LTTKSLDFTLESLDLGLKSLDFAPKSVDLGSKSLDFTPKSVDFGKKKRPVDLRGRFFTPGNRRFNAALPPETAGSGDAYCQC